MVASRWIFLYIFSWILIQVLFVEVQRGIRLTAQSVDLSLCQNSAGCTTSALIQQHEMVQFELPSYHPKLVKQVNVAHSAKV
jgi:hypothetical protein